MIQSGDGDWIINPLPAGRPSGIELQRLQDGRIQDDVSVLKGWKAFYLAAVRAVERLPAK